MATIKTIKVVCPHCGRKAKSLFGLPQRNLKFYGCTLRRCNRCMRSYIDYRITEIGMCPKEETYPNWHQLYFGWIMYGSLVVVGIGIIAYEMKGLSGTLLGIGAMLLLGGYATQILTNLLTLKWRRRRWQEEYDNSLSYLGRQRASK